MKQEKTYTLDISEYRSEDAIIRVKCTAIQSGEIWQCSFEEPDLETPLTFKEIKAIKKAIYPLFQKEIVRLYGPSELQWEGEKRHPLLQFRVGDTVKYSGQQHEIVYVIPEAEKCGVRTKEGKLLNDIKFSEIQLALLKRK